LAERASRSSVKVFEKFGVEELRKMEAETI